MPVILFYFLGGLAASLGVGVACYYAVGFSAGPLLQTLFGERAGPMWGRLFRMSVVTVALVGGLSSKFYGCGGPTDYADIARSQGEMFGGTTEQVSSSMHFAMHYLVAAAAVGALAYAAGRSGNQ